MLLGDTAGFQYTGIREAFSYCLENMPGAKIEGDPGGMGGGQVLTIFGVRLPALLF